MTTFTDVYTLPGTPSAEHLFGSATHDPWPTARVTAAGVSVMDAPPPYGSSAAKLTTAMRGLPIDGFKLPDWVDWFYYRIYVLPETLELGTLASSQVRVVRVWNAYLDRKNLDAIVITQPEGITVDGFASGEWRALKIESYDVSIQETGPVIIDSAVQWDFSDADDALFSELANLLITGQRITIIPYVALDNASETLEWKTDVLKGYGLESRRGLRSAPRQTIEYSGYVSKIHRQKLEAMLLKQAGAYAVPVWWEQQAVGAVAAGALSVSMDTDNTDLRVGGLILLKDSDDVFEAVEVSAIGSGVVNLSRAVTNNYSNATACPARVGYLTSSVIDRQPVEHNFAKMAFVINEYAVIAGGSYTQHQGYDVLLDPSVATDSLPLTIRMARVWNDNGIGGMKPYGMEDRTRVLDVQRWIKQGRANAWALRQWVCSRYGQRIPFYVPTWQQDYTLLATVLATDTTMTMEYTGQDFPLDVYIELTDGTTFLRNVSDITVDGVTGNEEWTIDSQFGQSVAPADIKKISRLRLLRHDSDKVTIEHSTPDLTRASVPLTTV